MLRRSPYAEYRKESRRPTGGLESGEDARSIAPATIALRRNSPRASAIAKRTAAGARSQTLETLQLRTLPSRRRRRYGLREPSLAAPAGARARLPLQSGPRNEMRGIERPIKERERLIRYSKAAVRVAEERPGQRCCLGILRQAHEIVRNAAHLERIATVASPEKCRFLTFETPRSAAVRQVVNAEAVPTARRRTERSKQSPRPCGVENAAARRRFVAPAPRWSRPV